jgi:hypothetical protein
MLLQRSARGLIQKLIAAAVQILNRSFFDQAHRPY